MSKRLAIVFFVVIGSIIFAIAGFCLMLFLAPGFSAFGVKYIRSDLHFVWTGKVAISDTKLFETQDGSTFLGNVIVETHEVPVNVIYTENLEYYFEYYDNYSGFTTSKFDDPSFTITKDEQGNCVFKVQEFKKFVYESSSSKRYFNLYIPLQFVSESQSYSKSVTVRTDSAPITFVKEDLDDTRMASHNKVTVETKSGRVKFKDIAVRANTLTYKTGNTIKLYGDQNKEFYAENYDLESRLGRIVINGPVGGNVYAKTNSGDIMVESCKNLKVETKNGDVYSSNKDKLLSTRGIVNIETTSGNVILGDINGTGVNTIKTGGGRVTINKIKTAEISTKRGSVTIKSVTDAKIESNVGKVTVEESLNSINVKTKRGNILLGGRGIKMNNVTAFSNLGKIDILSASGKVDVVTVKNNITFTNGDSTEMKFVSGKKLTAKGLAGKVNIVSAQDVYLEFTKITDSTIIELKDTCKSIVVKAETNTIANTNFYFEGASVRRYEDEALVNTPSSRLEGAGSKDPTAYIKITGANAVIDVYFTK